MVQIHFTLTRFGQAFLQKTEDPLRLEIQR